MSEPYPPGQFSESSAPPSGQPATPPSSSSWSPPAEGVAPAVFDQSVPPPGHGLYHPPLAVQALPKVFLPTSLKDSMRFFHVPARKWWWGLIALAAYVICFLALQFLVAFVLIAVDPTFLESAVGGEIVTTPTLFLVNNIGISLDIAVCTLIAWLFFRQGFGWLVSVVGRFRWKWFAVALGLFALGYLLETVVEIIVYTPADYGFSELEMQPYTWFMIVSILVTTPLQCAGEEFQSRALLARLIAAIIPFRWVGLALSALIPSTVFMLLHDAQDPWLNINYFCVALMMWWLAYRTGGIEASIALHIVNNLFSEWMMPFSDFSDMFDRSEGTGSPIIVAYLGVQLVLVLIVDYVARRRGLVRMSSPGAATPEVVKPRRLVTRIAGSVQVATKDDLPRFESTVREVPFQNSWMAPPYAPGYPHSVGGPVPYAQQATVYGPVGPMSWGPVPPSSPVPVPDAPASPPADPIAPSPTVSLGATKQSVPATPEKPVGPRRAWIEDSEPEDQDSSADPDDDASAGEPGRHASIDSPDSLLDDPDQRGAHTELRDPRLDQPGDGIGM